MVLRSRQGSPRFSKKDSIESLIEGFVNPISGFCGRKGNKKPFACDFEIANELPRYDSQAMFAVEPLCCLEQIIKTDLWNFFPVLYTAPLNTKRVCQTISEELVKVFRGRPSDV